MSEQEQGAQMQVLVADDDPALSSPPEAPQPAKVPDLMAALEASLAAVKGDAPAKKAKGKADAKPAARKKAAPKG